MTYDEALQSAVEKESKIRFPLFMKYQSFYRIRFLVILDKNYIPMAWL